MPSTSRQPSFALLLALAFALVAAQLLFQHWGRTVETLNDTDDAMRLVEMRAFVGGQGWFDLHQARVQPPIGLNSHWSRLIDAGLAGLFLLFNLFVDAALAERLMRACWPLLWLIPTLIGTTAIAWRVAGRDAAVAALLLATLGLPAFTQFHPGRIDHHNVQIALALLTVAATVWSDRVRWAATAAGVATGLAVAIGLEGLPFAAMCGAAFAMRFALDASQAGALRDYGLALGLSLLIALGVSVAPDQWWHSACDMIAFNLVLPAAVGGLLLAAASRFANASRAVRCGLVIAIGGVALALFAWLEPRCLAGPFAMMDPAIWPIWLAHVNEMQPLARLARNDALTAAWLAAFPALALVAIAVLAHVPEKWGPVSRLREACAKPVVGGRSFGGRRQVRKGHAQSRESEHATRRDAGFLTAAAAFLIAAATTLATVKGAPYAMWFGMPLVAALAIRLFALFAVHSLVPRFAVAMLLTPTALAGGAVAIAVAMGHDNASERGRSARQACFASGSYAALARLPPGLVAADVDYGPFLLALTPHSAVAAPYHRLSAGILAAHEVFAVPPPTAREILARLHAAYVVTCGPREPLGLNAAQRTASLWGHLQAGEIPGWLDPIAHTPGQPLRVYRVKGPISPAAGPVRAPRGVLPSTANGP